MIQYITHCNTLRYKTIVTLPCYLREKEKRYNYSTDDEVIRRTLVSNYTA